MKYDQLILYYFSGTGNARNAAIWIENFAKKEGIKTHLINIDRFEAIDVPKLSDKTLIGFFSPTHGFNVPPIVLKFLLKFPIVKNVDTFVLNTRGGLKLHKLFIPGISGAAQLLPALILMFKGFKIVGMQPLDLPSNWIILHPGLREIVVNSIYERCKRIVDNFATGLLNGKRKYKALLSLPIDIALLPIALAYYFIVRFFLAKTLIATDACNNCGKCIIQCPVKAIKIINDRPFWSYKCESCMRCVNACPQRAIETTHAFSITLLLVSSIVISPLLITGLKYLGVKDWFYQSIMTRNLWSVIDAIVFLLFVFLSYRVLHYLMRFKFINRIITYTSLSKYKFWRRYKPPGYL
ncbi:MAG: 4Fe-4S dicluster domain-containing protein [Bacteroidales bacterium]|nr:4Fe-4S dicluster domain-containing protein [Bacteroidales bacterium]